MLAVHRLYILTQPFGSSGSSFKDKMQSWADKLNITHATNAGSTTSSRGQGRSLQAFTAQSQQQQQQQPEGMWDDSAWQLLGQGSDAAPVTDPANWSAHVTDVVQQIQDFAGQLQHKQRLQEATPNVPESAPPATATGLEGQTLVHHGDQPAQRQLLQASPARTAGISTQKQPPAFTKTAPETAQQARERVAAQRAAVEAAERARSRDLARQQGAARYPTLYVVNSHISDGDFPRFYKTGDAFVLPTRGEGWGRPHVESMSMG